MRFFIFYILLSFNALLAASHAVFFNPGIDGNWWKYYNSIRRGYEVTNSVGFSSVNVFTATGKWTTSQRAYETLSNVNYTNSKLAAVDQNERKKKRLEINYPPVSAEVKNFKELVKSIEKLSLEEGDDLLVFIGPHGNEPKNWQEPLTASLSTYYYKESYDIFLRELKKLNTKATIRFILSACYGGAIHTITRQLPNTCSMALSPYFSPTTSGWSQEPPFSIHFWDNIYRRKGNLSFGKAALFGFNKDVANLQMGRLSSFDFIDYVLKTGPYSGDKWRIAYKFVNFPEYRDKFTREGAKDFVQNRLPEKFEMATEADALVYGPENFDEGFATNFIAEDLQQFDRYERIVIQLKKDTIYENQKIIFDEILEEIMSSGSIYAQNIDLALQDPLLFRKNESKFREIHYLHGMLKKLDGLEKFNEVASREERENLIRLLLCEFRPLVD